MRVALIKEGRVTPQMAYSERDLQWLLKSGWTRLDAPETVKVVEPVEPERKKPGRKPKAR